jgi:hypothetical protein
MNYDLGVDDFLDRERARYDGEYDEPEEEEQDEPEVEPRAGRS